MIFIKNKALIFLFIACSSSMLACNQAEQSPTTNAATGNGSTPVESVSASPTATPLPSALSPNADSMSPASVPTNNTNQSRGNPTATSQPPQPAPQTNKPPTKTVSSTGAQDFFVFSAVRGALNDDPELKNENITVDVKNGVVILTGTVTAEAKSKRAAQIAGQVENAKNLKNLLRVGINR